MDINTSLHHRQRHLAAILHQSWLPHLKRVSQLNCTAPIDSRLQSYLQTGITTIYWIISLVLSYKTIVEYRYQQNGIEQFLFSIYYSGSLFISSTIFLRLKRQQKMYTKFVKRIVDIQVQMENLMDSQIEPFQKLRLKMNRLVCVLIIIEVIIFFLELYLENYLLITLVTLIIFIIPNTIAILTLIQLVEILYIMSEEFCTLNKIIQENHCSNWKSRESYIVYSVTPILLQRRNNANEDKENILNIIRKLHIQLTELYDEILEVFGVFLVSFFVVNILEFVIDMYIVYRYAVNLTYMDWTICVFCTIWILLHGGPLYVLFFNAELMHNEVFIIKLTCN